MTDLLKNIKTTIENKEYLLRPHVISHMLSEGFLEKDIIEAIINGKILELYEDENRCLIVGTFRITSKMKEHLHIVVDYWSETDNIDWIDIVTAYIPRRPYWITAKKRGKKK